MGKWERFGLMLYIFGPMRIVRDLWRAVQSDGKRSMFFYNTDLDPYDPVALRAVAKQALGLPPDWQFSLSDLRMANAGSGDYQSEATDFLMDWEFDPSVMGRLVDLHRKLKEVRANPLVDPPPPPDWVPPSNF